MAIFTPTGGAPLSTSAASAPPGIGTPQQITIVAANTEQAIALPAGLQGYFIVNRGATVLRVAFTSGGTNTTDHYTLNPRGGYQSPVVYIAAASTMYVQAQKAGDVVQLITYT